MNDYLNPNGGYYKVKKQPKGPNHAKILIAVAATIAVGGIGISVLKGKNGNSNNDTYTPVPTQSTEVVTTNGQNNIESNQVSSESQLAYDATPTAEPKPTNLAIDPIAANEMSIDRIGIDQIHDSISQEDEKKTYELNTTEAGTYRIEFSDVPQNVQFTLYLYNSNMEQLAKEYDKTNGGGITLDLDANTLYYIMVEQEDSTGSYTLNIGRQKPTIDLTGYTKVSDSTQFTDQKNIYCYTTTEAGTYRFDFTDVPNNIQFTEYVYNANMEQLSKEYDKTNNRGITIDLEAETIKSQLEQAGIDVNIVAVETKVFNDMRADRDYDIVASSWAAEYPDISSFLYEFQSHEFKNYAEYENPEYDALYAQLLQDSSDSRMELVHRAEDMIMNDVAAVPLFMRNRSFITNDGLNGYYHDITGCTVLKYVWEE